MNKKERRILLRPSKKHNYRLRHCQLSRIQNKEPQTEHPDQVENRHQDNKVTIVF